MGTDSLLRPPTGGQRASELRQLTDAVRPIEIDGSVHDWHDETRRTTFLEPKGFTVLRFTNDDVEEGGVGEYIKRWMKDQGHIPEEQE